MNFKRPYKWSDIQIGKKIIFKENDISTLGTIIEIPKSDSANFIVELENKSKVEISFLRHDLWVENDPSQDDIIYSKRLEGINDL